MNEPLPVPVPAPGTPPAAAPVPAPVAAPVPAPVTPPAGLGLVGDPQKMGTDTTKAGWWRDHMSPEFRDHTSMQTIESLDDLAKTYINGQQMIGKDKIVRVNADSDAKSKQAFMKDLGWGFSPDTAAGYELDVAGIEGFGDLAPMKDFMGDLFHKHDVPTQAGKEIFREFIENQAAQQAEDLKLVQQDKQEKLNTLREKLGPSFDFTLTKAQRAMHHLSPDGNLSKLIAEAHLEAEPEIIELFATLADNILGDNLNPQNLMREFTTTPDQAKAEITQLQTDEEFMKIYQTRDAAGHAEAVERMKKLFNLAHPEQ